MMQGVGLGLRNPHLREVLAQRPDVPWWEVHTENFFSTGAAASRLLLQLAEYVPLSMHCVGLSLGSADGVDAAHLAKVKEAVARYRPVLVSDHISWSGAAGHFAPDLLPVPYTEEALAVMVRNITQVQEALGRRILVENPSSYIMPGEQGMTEWEFIDALVHSAECDLLLDVNNLYVSCHNHGWNARDYLAALPQARVKEMHLAGFSMREVSGETVLIDTHSAPVHAAVMALFKEAVQLFPDVPVLMEWDNDLPTLEVLLQERQRIEDVRDAVLKRQKAA